MFYLFCGERRYPKGGSGDYVGKFETIEEAKEMVPRISQYINRGGFLDIWAEIIDSQNMKSVSFIELSEFPKNEYREICYNSRAEYEESI